MGNPALGVETALLGKLEGTPGSRESLAAGSNHYDLVSETLDAIPVLSSDWPVLAGDRQRRAAIDIVTHNDVQGGFIIRPRSAQLDSLLSWILGKASGSAFIPLNDDSADLPQHTLEVTKGGQDQIALIGCKVNTAILRSEANGPLTFEIAVIAQEAERNTGVFTSWAATELDLTPPFLHGGLAFANGPAWFGGNVEARMIEFTLNNNLDPEGYCNSMNRRIIPVGIFSLEGSMEIPYNATTKAFWTDMIGATKVEFDATWTSGSDTLAAHIVAKLDGELPKISGPENIWATIGFHGVIDSSDASCIILESTE